MVGDHRLINVDTLTARVADLIREMITDMRPGFEPGARINPRELAQQLGVSETPVKQALLQLSTHGLVRIFPRRGTFVAKLSRREVDELIDVRCGLEVIALRLTGGRLPDAVLESMQDCVANCEKALKAGDRRAYRLHDELFHMHIVRASGNSQLERIYQSLVDSTRILDVYNPRYREQQIESQSEHRKLVEVFRRGDMTASEAALTEHWSTSKQRMVQAYSAYLDHNEQPE